MPSRSLLTTCSPNSTAILIGAYWKWMAYTSDQAGQLNVYIQPFPKGGPIQVSRDGGGQPVWRADGKELFFLGPDGTMMAAPIQTVDPCDVGAPLALFPAILPSTMTLGAQQYAVTRDGKRFLVIARPDQPSVAPLTVVIHWTAAIQN